MREPTEEEWAAVGRYLAGRYEAKAIDNGMTQHVERCDARRLIGRDVVQAVMRAIVLDDEASKRLKGGET
jgi:hypothetical protein